MPNRLAAALKLRNSATAKEYRQAVERVVLAHAVTMKLGFKGFNPLRGLSRGWGSDSVHGMAQASARSSIRPPFEIEHLSVDVHFEAR